MMFTDCFLSIFEIGNVLLYLGTQLERLHQFENVKFILQILDQEQVSGWTSQKKDLGLLLHIQRKILNGKTTVPWFSGPHLWHLCQYVHLKKMWCPYPLQIKWPLDSNTILFIVASCWHILFVVSPDLNYNILSVPDSYFKTQYWSTFVGIWERCSRLMLQTIWSPYAEILLLGNYLPLERVDVSFSCHKMIDSWLRLSENLKCRSIIYLDYRDCIS